jgi:F-type H+-transporting ATPase subunit b
MAVETIPPPGPDSALASAGTGEVTATTEAHGGSESGGLPQFKFEYWGGQIVWLLLIFVVLYTLLATVFVPRLRRILDTRAKTIADAVEQARTVQAEAEVQAAAAKAEVDAARAQARALAGDARTKALADLARSQAAEDERLEAELAKADERIRAMRDAALTNVGDIAADAASDIVAKLTGVKVTGAEIKSAQGAA